MSRRKSSISDVIQSRQVIPRWTSASSAASVGERSVAKYRETSERARRFLRIAQRDFERHNSEATANEYLQTANLLGLAKDPLALTIVERFPRVSVALERSRRILDKQFTVSPSPEAKISTVEDHRAAASSKAHALRQIVHSSSDRPLAWTELARQYVILGEVEKAGRAMRVALHLAADNVYITRCAVRMFTHLDQPDIAIKLLHKNMYADSDPWLMAADIATSASMGKTSRNLRKAHDVLTLDRTNDHRLSELASAVATVELERGSRKRSRELFKKSLVAPTENSLAQAQWCVSKGDQLAIPEAAWRVASSHEATALAARSAIDFSAMMSSCRSWFADEPFSSRPAALASTTSFDPTLREQAKAFATLGLEYAPTNSTLLNNRAVCFAYDGALMSAFDDLRSSINVEDFDHYGVALATLGLILFRSGDPLFGRECYQKSIRILQRSGETEAALRATVHQAIEESRFDVGAGAVLLDSVREPCRRVDKSRFPELKGVLDVAEQTIPAQAPAAKPAFQVLRPAKEEFSEIEAAILRKTPERLT